jgi:hypothetical protein
MVPLDERKNQEGRKVLPREFPRDNLPGAGKENKKEKKEKMEKKSKGFFFKKQFGGLGGQGPQKLSPAEEPGKQKEVSFYDGRSLTIYNLDMLTIRQVP